MKPWGRKMKRKHIKYAVFAAAGGAALAGTAAKKLATKDEVFLITEDDGKSGVPMVLVHGLGGWGEGSTLDTKLPHWGLMAGSIKNYLAEFGYDAYAASVNPVTSTWDRACELYAHLTGARTDYGAAHAKAYGHDRYGPIYEKLGPDWPNQKIHLVAHSFGGATVRLLAQLCAEGCAEERAATPEGELSPLFSGNLGGSIASITTLASPHNGTTAMSTPVKGAGISLLEGMIYSLMAANIVSPGIRGFYPCILEQYGITGGTGLRGAWKQSVALAQSDENAKCDTSIDGAAIVNRGIECRPDIYYFSYAGDITHERSEGHRLPNAAAFSPITAEPALRMGQQRLQRVTPGGVEVNERWLPNDGQVNTISALYPFGEPHRDYDPADVRPGAWQVMPVVKNWDHYDFVGGFRVGGTKGVKAFYLSMARMLDQLA